MVQWHCSGPRDNEQMTFWILKRMKWHSPIKRNDGGFRRDLHPEAKHGKDKRRRQYAKKWILISRCHFSIPGSLCKNERRPLKDSGRIAQTNCWRQKPKCSETKQHQYIVPSNPEDARVWMNRSLRNALNNGPWQRWARMRHQITFAPKKYLFKI